VYTYNLRLVGLDSCSRMDDLLVESFAVNCPRLEGIHLTTRMNPTTAVSDRAKRSLAENCGGNLLYLSLCGLLQVTGTGLSASATHCCNLQELQLECCRSVTADSLGLLVSSLPRLRELALHDMSTVTDAVLAAIDRHAGHPHSLKIAFIATAVDAALAS
jgi:hypothetical protein